MTSRVSPEPTAYRFTRDEYYRLAEVGFFQDERVELLDGEIIAMSPQLSPHAFSVTQLVYLLGMTFGSTAVVRGQLPIMLNNWSEPEPDVALCQPDPQKYRHAHPRADQVWLVIEIAESSLRYDRTRKARAYATSGIPQYWIVNLIDRRVEVYTDPDPAARVYRQQRHVSTGDVLPLPGGPTLVVDDILP